MGAGGAAVDAAKALKDGFSFFLIGIFKKQVKILVNANISQYERDYDVNHQYTACEHKGCENPKSTTRHCTLHMKMTEIDQDEF